MSTRSSFSQKSSLLVALLLLALLLLCVVARAEDSSSDVISSDDEKVDAQVVEETPSSSEQPAAIYEEPPTTPFHRAVEQLYIEKNFTAGIELLHQAVAEGDGQAMALLALFYTHGIGVNRSEARAILLYEFAALAGSVGAHLALSHRYEHGLGVVQSCHEAVKHARAAANEVALKHTSDITAKVRFVELDNHHSTSQENIESDLINAHYFRAEKGQVGSKVFLGYSHLLGLNGVDQDGNLAEKYFLEAAEANDPAAFGALGQLYSQGVSSADPPIERDPDQALYYFRKGAEANHQVSLNGMGYLYASGSGVEQDFEAAAKYFSQSAAQGNAEGIYNLGVLFLNGKGVAKDVNQAAQHFLQAAVRGSVLANWQLGHLNLQGKGNLPKSCTAALRNYRLVVERGPWVKRISAAYDAYQEQDYSSALLDYLIAAEFGFSIGLRNAAHLLHQGHTLDGVSLHRPGRNAESSSQEEAGTQILLSLLERSAREGSAEAHIKLGDYYYRGGDGGTPNYAKAEEHYQVAASLNHPQALFNLGMMHQHGGSIGLRQDFHLAKRYYDQALALSSNSYFAVQMALYYLNFHWWWTHFSSRVLGDEELRSSSGTSSSGPRGAINVDGLGSEDEELSDESGTPSFVRELFNVIANLVDGSRLPTPFGYPLDTFALFVCIGLSVVLLLLRHHAVDAQQ